MLNQVIALVRQVARDEVMPRYLKVAHSHKTDGSMCTEADVACQHALTAGLREIAPYPVLGEEMTEEEQIALWAAGTEGLWCIDPIDGTSNFVNGIPYFALSVALMKNGKKHTRRDLRPGGGRDVLCRTRPRRVTSTGKACPSAPALPICGAAWQPSS
jgi:Archaeal fructose-1,6-bisphosphatase and related enzymes of inositol monophosphatase family